MTNKSVADACHIDWKTVKAIDKKSLYGQKVGLYDISLAGIGADEVAYENGQGYLTIVRKLKRNMANLLKEQVLDIFEEQDQDTAVKRFGT